jgi:hypothetical protein
LRPILWSNNIWSQIYISSSTSFVNFSNWEGPLGFHDFVSGNLFSQFIVEDYGLCYSEVEFMWRWAYTQIAEVRTFLSPIFVVPGKFQIPL